MSDEDVASVRQWVPDFSNVLPPASLGMVFLDGATMLNDLVLGDEQFGYAAMCDIRWADANLAVVDWTQTKRGLLGIKRGLFGLRKRVEAIELGDERKARDAKDGNSNLKDETTRLREYKDAVRANRQLATALRQQGLNEDADRFAFKAQRLQRQVLRRQQRCGAAFGSWVLDRIAGYGYRPWRSIVTYLLVVAGFAVVYLALGGAGGHALAWNEALVVSLTAFHGRGFFATAFQPGDPQAAVAALEAVIGLLIEITFIATFTQRFFAR